MKDAEDALGIASKQWQQLEKRVIPTVGSSLQPPACIIMFDAITACPRIENCTHFLQPHLFQCEYLNCGTPLHSNWRSIHLDTDSPISSQRITYVAATSRTDVRCFASSPMRNSCDL